jgi:hypothetical protein
MGRGFDNRNKSEEGEDQEEESGLIHHGNFCWDLLGSTKYD